MLRKLILGNELHTEELLALTLTLPSGLGQLSLLACLSIHLTWVTIRKL